ncbi:MAG TPA: ABC transporter ATP-binding protein [Spirochaetia bacterium]|nr:ABC transporter ATP-binding protein [Spirochaetia bacterium]
MAETTLAKPILEVKNLTIEYPINIGTVRAVRDVSFSLYPGETLGLVGESGCGKSTLGLSLLRLLRPPGRIAEGQLLFRGRDIVKMRTSELLTVRGSQISMVFQNPLTSLDPLYRVRDHFWETLRTHRANITRAEALDLAAKILEQLGIESKRLDEYPHQLSGGMRQRIMIGLGLVLDPDILIADEPTTSLDVIVEAGFVDLLKELGKKYGISIILISHNLAMVAEIADRIAVMYGGRIVEIGNADAIFSKALHPYAQGLIGCVPNIELDMEELVSMPGSPPDLVAPPPGCPFAPRCPKVMDVCRTSMPPLKSYAPRQEAACWLYEPEGAKHPVAGALNG